MIELENLWMLKISEESRENPDNIDVEESVNPEAPVYVARGYGGIHMPPEYLLKMDIDVKNTNIYDNKTQRTR